MTIKLRGFETVKRELQALEPRLQKNVLRGATFAVAREIRNDAKQDAPREFGTLEDNIIAKRRRGRRGESQSSVMVLTEGKRDDPKNAFYWRFQEFGYFLRDGSTWMPGSHFITNAYEGMRDRVDSVMARYIRPRIDKALKK